jgi:hypothetical protein
MTPHDISLLTLTLAAGVTLVSRSVTTNDGPAVAVATSVGVTRYVPPTRGVWVKVVGSCSISRYAKSYAPVTVRRGVTT